jgi:hypothetical protein
MIFGGAKSSPFAESIGEQLVTKPKAAIIASRLSLPAQLRQKGRA